MIAAEVTIDSPAFGHLELIVTAIETELAAAGVNESLEVVLADAGYWHQAQMERIVSRGTVVLVPPDAGKRKGARPGWDGGLYAFMRRVLATDHGGELYGKHKGMIEPVFGHTKFNRRIDRFQRRGRSACRSEWRLITATHNLQKLHRPPDRGRRGLKPAPGRDHARRRRPQRRERQLTNGRSQLYATATAKRSSAVPQIDREACAAPIPLEAIARRWSVLAEL